MQHTLSPFVPGTRKRGSLIVEGWRFLPHSYALPNQYQCLEIMRRGDVELYHRDAPYFAKHWQPLAGLLTNEAENILRGIPQPADDQAADVTLRMRFPLDFSSSRSQRTYVWGTAELGIAPASFVAGGIPLGKACAQADVSIITPSQWSRDGFVRSGVAAGRVHVVPLGVDSDLFKPADANVRTELRRRLGWDGFVFLNVGALTGNKGIDILLRSFAEVVRRRPQALLVLKGLDSLYGSQTVLERMIRALGERERSLVMPRLRYCGQTLSGAEMACFYQAADAYVAPYRGEGFNLPALEAASCGLPVICTKGGPTDDFTSSSFARPIQSRSAAVVVEPGCMGQWLEPDENHLVELMDSTFAQPDFVSQARQTGPAFVRANFTWERVVDRLLQILFP
jgi:glycosyltransferase involved in cell wall biosynthesis